MTAGLFDDPSLYAAATDQQRGQMRALALGGVLQTLRAGKGWSVEQAAVHAGLGHMTWRRMEDGFNVRAKTYAAVDTLFDLPFGTVRRALNDDLLMVQLIAGVGVDTGEVTTASAPAFVDTFARQTLSRAARQTVKARAEGVARDVGRVRRLASTEDTAAVTTSGASGLTVAGRPLSDVEAVANVLDRLTRRAMTPRLERAVRALLDAMPDLIAHEHTHTDDEQP